MSEVTPFVFEDQMVRTVMIDGAPWFTGKDVCSILGIKDHNQALDRLDDDERGGYTVPTPQGPQDMIVVSEAGIYRLIFTSRKPEAERFKRWLAHEVLPTLRKTGTYTVPGRAVAPLPAEEEPVGVLNLKLGMVREARFLFGAARARDLWGFLGMPVPPGQPAPIPDGYDGSAALRHLFDSEAADGRLYRDLLDANDREALTRAGIRIEDGDRFWIANRSKALEAVFAGTRWGKLWRTAWRSIEGATTGKPYKVDKVTTQGWSIPMQTLRDLGL